jgi:hypothetical protein
MSRTGADEGDGVDVPVCEDVGVTDGVCEDVGVTEGVTDEVGVAVLPLDSVGVGVEDGVIVGVRVGVGAATIENAELLKVAASTVITAVYLVPPDPGTKVAGQV